ncbi:hypothetical protein [Desulfobacula toluolica]|uniref:Uncharacterized protein n=1 Tax=Desulfobacula toluolica (strain DSM 7467 / Tol2) TaxID=651182 RepID=K0NIK7_DESTT|nr:hypothetical protein [Desulfobacula toluolica]CCK81246.1 uncharacterized protein TOL2_C30890 [Desulfobacula toluolica Tol2]
MNLINQITTYKTNEQMFWNLNPHTNPLSHSTMLFAYYCDNSFYPIGTIFFVGNFGIMLSASHVFDEGLSKSNHNQQVADLLAKGKYHVDVKGDLGFAAIRFNSKNDTVSNITFISIEHIAACVPGDIFYASPVYHDSLIPIEYLSIKPTMPEIGTKVFSCGYTNFDYDRKNGLPLDEIKSGRFNWRDNLSFDFAVYEGEITNIYVNKFVKSYLNAPCFSVNYKIPPGLSGGPTLTKNGFVCGVNSASLVNESLISLIYPSIFTSLKTTMRIGGLTLNKIAPICDHMSFGNISTDGSEKDIKYSIEHDSLCVYHKWFKYLDNQIYENKYDEESGIFAKPRARNKKISIGIGPPITEEPSHTTGHTDRVSGGSADQAD